MRIIAGEFRGRRLLTPQGRNIRPTSDRVREALFSVIAARVDGAHVLDLFAGTGALGLEALSRGAAQAVFVDHGNEATRLIEENIRRCGAHARARVLRRPILQSLTLLAKERLESGEFDLVFLDPPYGLDQVPVVLVHLADLRLVADSALAVAEHHRQDTIPTACRGWQKTQERRYGDTVLSFFSRGSADEPSS